jgi:predicted metal-dependent enzyme (double-stranded beta helix superfamily)
MFEVEKLRGCVPRRKQGVERRLLDEGRGGAAVRNGYEITAALGRPDRGGFDTLCRTDDLTILRFVWPPRVQLFPHDHQMRAVIGIYEGAEDNEFFRRSSDGLQPSGGRRIEAGAVVTLGHDVVHAVANPRATFTAALHVYQGDFFAARRTQWDPVTHQAAPYDVDEVRRVLREADERAGTVG